MTNDTKEAVSEETSVTVAVEIAVSMATVEFIRCLTIYVAPVIAVTGILGNGVVIATLRSVPKTSSWSLYVVALNAAQVLHLAVQLDTWTSDIGYGVYGVVGGWCQLVTFVSSATEFLIVWSCVLLGLDRAVGRRGRRASTTPPCGNRVGFARAALVSAGVVSVVVYVNVSLVYGEVRYGDGWSATRCLPLDAFDAAVRRLRLAEAVLNSVLPMTILVSCVVIVAATAVLNRESTTSSRPRGGRRIGGGAGDDAGGAFGLKMEGGDRCSLLLLSAFLVSNVPVHGFRDYLAVTSFRSDGHVTLGDYLALQALLIVKRVGESANFFLLLVSSKLFRRTLIRRFKMAPKKKRMIMIFQTEHR